MDLVLADGYRFQFPVFVICNRAPSGQLFIEPLPYLPVGRTVAIYTDDDLLRRATEAMGLQDLAPLACASSDELKTLLVSALDAGVKHASVDVCTHGGGGGHFRTLEEILYGRAGPA